MSVGPQVVITDRVIEYRYHDRRRGLDSLVTRVTSPQWGDRLGAYTFPSLGLGNRVQWTAALLPLWPMLTFWSADISVTIVDRGRARLFRSIAGAGFVGSSGTVSEWDTQVRAWCGGVLGSYADRPWGDIELVAIPSLWYSVDEKGLPGNMSAGMKEYALDLSAGVLVCRIASVRCQLGVGVSYRIPLRMETYWSSSSDPDFGMSQVLLRHRPVSLHLRLAYTLTATRR